MPVQILVIDDDEKICKLIAKLLRREGYDVTYVINANEAFEAAKLIMVDLIISDIMMPGINGKELTEKIRTGKSYFSKTVPIIMVSALYDVSDRISGIKQGADDYLVKPFEPEELSIRVAALLRRTPIQRTLFDNQITVSSDIHLDIEQKKILIHDILIDVTDKEVAFLKMIMAHPNVPIHKHEIMRHLYPELNNSPESRTLEVMIGRLRKKLEENNCTKIKTKRGDGYYWSQ